MTAVVLERHPKLYLPDGDIVLRASKSAPAAQDGAQHYQLFRVHKFLLKYHSAPFGHMFADARVGSDEAYDGVPMAEMHGDRAEDLGLLLNYIYNPSELSFKRFDPNTPLIIGGAIRIADKYLIEPLRDHLVKQVPAAWPTTLKEWDRFDDEISAIRKDVPQNPPTEHTISVCDLIPEPVSAILFAQEFGCPEILPAAFYQLSRIKYTDNWDDQGKRRVYPTVPQARWSLLEKENLVRCMHGFQKLDDFFPDAFDSLSVDCRESYIDFDGRGAAGSSCLPFIQRLFSLAWEQRRSVTIYSWQRDPLRMLRECIDFRKFPELSTERPKGLCERCNDSLQSVIEERRKELWEHLPEYFKLN
ncbi:hypothetical protein OH76DRAFT_1345701 [Lentinus brumalis]|uniref:BTB domain-containing protein n=1 Tax=Lentinus brumalis TaxID=2498619 RepID=A0A371DIH8_9APHY|nr:hypothetical protein OH76DRAFT_1345701 [Polyporus brumalis]